MQGSVYPSPMGRPSRKTRRPRFPHSAEDAVLDERVLVERVGVICDDVSAAGTYDLESVQQVEPRFCKMTTMCVSNRYFTQQTADQIQSLLAGITADATSRKHGHDDHYARLCAKEMIGSLVVEMVEPYTHALEDRMAEDEGKPATPRVPRREVCPPVPELRSKPPPYRPTRWPKQEERSLLVSQHYAAMVDPSWEGWKEAGNDALKRGDRTEALSCYTYALYLTQPNWPIYVFFEALNAWPEGSAAARLASAENDIGQSISRFLPDGPRSFTQDLAPVGRHGLVTYTPPNLPAAICLANRAAVHLKASRPQLALADAAQAARTCPEYVKGQFRYAQALRAAGKTIKAAAEESRLKSYQDMMAHCATSKYGWWPAICLLNVRMIDPEEFIFVYEHVRLKYFHDQMQREQVREIGAKACLVPFNNGQFLSVSAWREVIHEPGRREEAVDNLFLHEMDEAGADLAEEPPHGRATHLAMERVPRRLSDILHELERRKLKVTELRLGQGLTPIVSTIYAQLQDDGLSHVEVKCAGVTGAFMKTIPPESQETLTALVHMYPDLTLDEAMQALRMTAGQQ